MNTIFLQVFGYDSTREINPSSTDLQSGRSFHYVIALAMVPSHIALAMVPSHIALAMVPFHLIL